MDSNARNPRPDASGGRSPGFRGLPSLLAQFAAFVGSEREPHASSALDRRRLMLLLDRLASARARCPSAAHPVGPLPARGDELRRERIAARFPELGFYATVEPVLEGQGGPEEPTIGDAIDDLLDITVELERVAWYLAQDGRPDAERYYAWSFDVHWGWHLRELQRYLHALGE